MKEKSIYFVLTILLIPIILYTTKHVNAKGKEDIYIQINL